MNPLQHHPSRSSSSSIIFLFSNTLLLLNLMISINNFQRCLCQDDKQYISCNTPFTCGNSTTISNLMYPFWGGERDMYCGSVPNPNMELTCDDDNSGIPKLTINEAKNRILDWDNTTQILKVARDDYWDNICDVSINNSYENSSFADSVFQVESNTYNYLTLLYSCVTNGNTTDIVRTDCANNTGSVYAVLDTTSYSFNCTSSIIVVIPILGSEASSLVSQGRVTDALKLGFELGWSVNTFEEVCRNCVDSDGVCGNDGVDGFRCFCKDGAYKTTCGSEKVSTSSSKWNRRRLIGIGASLFGVAVTTLIVIIYKRKKYFGLVQERIFKKTTLLEDNVEDFIKSYKLMLPKRYSYVEVNKITNSFKDKLGHGGYGVVYKAILFDGRQAAVKLINECKGNGEEFINEVASISRTSHVNIVSLLGFCCEMNQRALIYEFMPNGSLDKFIYRSGSPSAICNLDWNKLYQIVVGIARGLEYLHQGCISRILHLDIKPQNILLDKDFSPKISDFGLAKICQERNSIVSMIGTRGTIGFIAPEVFSRSFGGVSHKSDVYSFGMLVLEMIGGRKNYDTGESNTTEMYFSNWINKDLELTDSLANGLAISDEEKDTVRKFTLVSLWCIQTNPSHRPSMSKVIEMLQGPLDSVPYPPKPVLYSPEHPSLQSSSLSSKNLLETSSITV